MGIRNFQDLDVYRKAFNISVTVHKASLNFPKIEQYALADQIRRACKSICANIAEGFAKQYASNAEYKRFLLMSLGSANEMLVWVEYCKTLDYIDGPTAELWHSEYLGVCKMLQSLYSSRKKLDN